MNNTITVELRLPRRYITKRIVMLLLMAGLGYVAVQNLDQLVEFLPWPHTNTDSLFQTARSPGSCAIGRAEGTLDSNCKPTALHRLHTDPGNFKPNSGFCSDQGRAGGDPVKADALCLERVQARLDIHIADLRAANLNPSDPQALVNTADLYNQASPIHSRRFPKLLAEEQAKHGNTIAAIAHARTRSFGEQGQQAGGLIGICQREGRLTSTYDCVYADQLRRVQAIDSVLATTSPQIASLSPQQIELRNLPVIGAIAERLGKATTTSTNAKYIYPVAGETVRSQGYHTYHEAIDIAGAEGLPILAARDGVVTVSGWDVNGCGNYVELTHDDGYQTLYCHNRKNLVQVGDRVQQGQAIAELGNTGNSTGPHLHFELKTPNGDNLDPTTLMDSS